ncbi:MAG: hypothetical protein ACTSQP_21575 [Promethearchaeota archaeon]
MDKLNKSDILKIKILKQFKKNRTYYTASYLAKILKTKYETIYKALEFFYQIDLLDKDIRHFGKKFISYYYLTELGQKLVESNKI